MSKEVKGNAENSILDDLISKAQKAQKIYATFSQEKVDEIFKACAIAINSRRIPLAKMACEETGMGIVEDKVIKNHFASEYIYNKYKHTKTCGIIDEDMAMGIKKVAEPIGVIAGVVPTTNIAKTSNIADKTPSNSGSSSDNQPYIYGGFQIAYNFKNEKRHSNLSTSESKKMHG